MGKLHSACGNRLGLSDLPQSVDWFTVAADAVRAVALVTAINFPIALFLSF